MKIMTVPAGITWEKTGRVSHVCTIRREPETVCVFEPQDYAALNAAARFNVQVATPIQYVATSALAGLLGALGL